MTTDPKTSNASGALIHPEPAADTNPRRLYEVTVHRTDYRYMELRMWAESEDDARGNARKRAALQHEAKWKMADRDCYVYSVEQVTEGGANV
jgi:hypothetical protein